MFNGLLTIRIFYFKCYSETDRLDLLRKVQTNLEILKLKITKAQQ